MRRATSRVDVALRRSPSRASDASFAGEDAAMTTATTGAASSTMMMNHNHGDGARGSSTASSLGHSRENSLGAIGKSSSVGTIGAGAGAGAGRWPIWRPRAFVAACAALALVCAVFTHERRSDTCWSAPEYVVFVDAGSTGCRAHAFKVSAASESSSLFTLETLGKKAKTKTALADMGGRVREELIPALKLAQANIDNDARGRANAQVYVWATAGFRVLTPAKQQALWAEVRDAVKRETTMSFGHGHFKTIDGADEGFYAWLAANYLSNVDVTSVGKLRAGGRPFSRVETPLTNSVGAIDVGGGSVQYVALPTEGKASLVKSMRDLRDVVKVESFLGYGANHMETRWRSALAAAGTSTNVCAFPGYTAVVDGVELKGTGSYADCVAGLRNQLAQMQREQRVDMRMPERFRNIKRFLGMSLLYHVTNFITIAIPGSLTSMPKATLAEIAKAGEVLCAMDWDTLLRDVDGKDPNTPTDRMNGRCFDAALVQALLGSERVNSTSSRGEHVGLGFTQNDKRIEFIEQITGAEVEWTLGATMSVVHPIAARANPSWAKVKTSSECARVFHTSFVNELYAWGVFILPWASVVTAYLVYLSIRATRSLAIMARSPSFLEIL
jgi:hypothetical protein